MTLPVRFPVFFHWDMLNQRNSLLLSCSFSYKKRTHLLGFGGDHRQSPFLTTLCHTWAIQEYRVPNKPSDVAATISLPQSVVIPTRCSGAIWNFSSSSYIINDWTLTARWRSVNCRRDNTRGNVSKFSSNKWAVNETKYLRRPFFQISAVKAIAGIRFNTT